MSSKQGHNIAMVGASGTIGSRTLLALLHTGVHSITIITRAESSATFPDNVAVKKGDYADESFLVCALKGHDVLILQLGFMATSQQLPLIHAAAKAGVKYVLPTEFGSDPYCSLATDYPMLGEKKQYRDAVEAQGMRWIAVINNPWFDWSLTQKAWGIDVAARSATLFSGAEAKFTTSTLAHVAEGVAALLSLPEDKLQRFADGPVYLSSFELTQRDILDSAIRATGTKESEWNIQVVPAEKAIAESRAQVAAGNHMAFMREFYIAHMMEGRGGNFQAKAAKDASVLGLEGKEVLDDVVRAVVRELSERK